MRRACTARPGFRSHPSAATKSPAPAATTNQLLLEFCLECAEGSSTGQASELRFNTANAPMTSKLGNSVSTTLQTRPTHAIIRCMHLPTMTPEAPWADPICLSFPSLSNHASSCWTVARATA
eukprot:3498047-Pyramimonas_sp.AAC.1